VAPSAENADNASRVADAQRDHENEPDMNCPPLIGNASRNADQIQTGKDVGKAKRSRGQALLWGFHRPGGNNSMS
jgi:hypothetical protein